MKTWNALDEIMGNKNIRPCDLNWASESFTCSYIYMCISVVQNSLMLVMLTRFL